jgi:hypothetical protein
LILGSSASWSRAALNRYYIKDAKVVAITEST